MMSIIFGNMNIKLKTSMKSLNVTSDSLEKYHMIVQTLRLLGVSVVTDFEYDYFGTFEIYTACFVFSGRTYEILCDRMIVSLKVDGLYFPRIEAFVPTGNPFQLASFLLRIEDMRLLDEL